MKSTLINIYDERRLKRKTLKAYKKLKKDKLLNIIRGNFATYDKLRMYYANLSLEYYALERKVKMLEDKLKVMSYGKHKTNFQDVKIKLKEINEFEKRRNRRRNKNETN